jgi:hypothetical protein
LSVGAREAFGDLGRNGSNSPPVIGSGSCECGAGSCRLHKEQLQKDAAARPPAMKHRLSISGLGSSNTLIFFSLRKNAFYGYDMFNL